jgi:hypothetical protein
MNFHYIILNLIDNHTVNAGREERNRPEKEPGTFG